MAHRVDSVRIVSHCLGNSKLTETLNCTATKYFKNDTISLMDQIEFLSIEESLSRDLSLNPLEEAGPEVLQRANPFLNRLKTDEERKQALQSVYYAKNVSSLCCS